MRRFWECKNAVSSVIGVVLLVGMTVIMVSIIALSVFAFAFEPPQTAPEAKIIVVEAIGDTDENLYENKIVLKHKGGDILAENSTEIIVTGKGYAYARDEPFHLPPRDIQIKYRDLAGNNYPYTEDPKEIVQGTSWETGESIELYGRDGINIGSFITHSQGNNVDCKWKLAAGSIVSVTVIHLPTNQIIATSSVTVRHP